jgi:tape measure domain-containing protein
MSDMTLRMLLLGEDRTASSSLRGVGSAAQDTSKHLHGIGTMGVAAGAAIGGLAAMGVASFGRMGLSAVTAGVQTAASMEQANIAFTSLLGSGQKSQAFLGKLASFAAATPFELPGLIDASRQLIGVGQSADSVIPTLTAFGDASGALGLSQDNFNHIMMATTQAMSAGTLHAGDLLQMTEAGLPVWKLMSEALGKPVATLKDMSAKGQLLTKDVMPKLQAQMEKDYGGSMAKQSQTLTGLWSTLMDTFHQGMAKALIPMEPMLRAAIPGAANVMGKALGALGNGVGQFFGGLSGHVKRMDQADRPKLELFGLGIRAMAGAFQSGDVTSKGFIGTMEKVGVTVRKIVDVLSGVFKQVMTWFKANGPTIFSGLMTSLKNLASVALPLVIQAWQAFKQPMQNLIQFVIQTAIPAIISITDWMTKHKTLVQTLAVAIGAIIAAIKIWSIVTKTITVLQTIWNAVMAANPIGIVILAIIGLAAAFVYAYKHSETFRNIVTGAFNAVKNVVMGVYNWVRNNWPLLLAILTGPIGLAVLFISRNLDKITGFFTKMPGRIASAASGMWDGVKNAFRSAVNWIIGAWNGLNFSIHIPKVHIKGTNVDIGGGEIGFGVPTIPMLANGGIVTGPTIAMLGEGGHPEAIIPLNRAKDYGFGSGSSIPVQVIVQMDGRTVASSLERVSHNGPPLRIRVAS